MTSHHDIHQNKGTLDAENLKAARMLILKHETYVVEFLARSGAKSMLLERCGVHNQDYYEIMAHRSSPGSEDDAMSQSSRQRSSSYKSHSQHVPSLSTDPSSLGNDDEIQVLWISPTTIPACTTTVEAVRRPHSNNLILASVVHNHLKNTINPFDSGKRVKCNERPLVSNGWTSLDWASNDEDLESGKSRRNIFYVVEKLLVPNVDIVLGDCEGQGSPVSFSGSTSFPTLNSPTL